MAKPMPVSPDWGAGGDRSPLRFRGYMDGSASRVSIPPPTALREARLNGSPEPSRGCSATALAAADDGRLDTRPKGSLGAAFWS